MFSIIVSSKDKYTLESILLPSLEPTKKYLVDNNKPEFQLVIIEGEHSITKNYNKGIDQSIWETKFFIHEDMDLMDNGTLLQRIHLKFQSEPNIGLIGLVGTTENPAGFWWNCSRDSIYGHVLSGKNKEYWNWKNIEISKGIKIIDGMFMATNKCIRFSEDIIGFHFYDSDYSNKIITAGYDICIIPHLTHHNSNVKDLSKINSEYYNIKWKR